MAINNSLLIAGLVAGGYVLYKSDFLGGLSSIGEGAGEAASGLGGGISEAAQGLGKGISDLSGQVTSITGDVAELTSFVGEFGNWTAQQFTELQSNSLRENTQADILDRGAFDKSAQQLTNIQAEKEINIATEQAERSALRQDFGTGATKAITSLPEAFVQAGSFFQPFSLIGLVNSWVTSRASPATAEDPIATIGGESFSSSSTALKVPTSSSGGSSSSIRSVGVTGNITQDIANLPAGASVLTIPYVTKSPNLKVSDPIVLKPKSTLEKIGGFFLRNFSFF